MGFFDKLRSGEKDDEEGEKKPASGAEGVLRVVRFGGYEQKSTLSSIKQVQDEIWKLEQALNAKKLEMSYTIPPEAEVAPLKRAKVGGFSEKDVNEYFDELFSRIRDLREQLGEDTNDQG